MAQMYAAVEQGYPASFDQKKRDHQISVTLARVLFLLFGDDTEMWTDDKGQPIPDLFQDFVKDHTARDGSDIGERVNALFRALNTAKTSRSGVPPEVDSFPYINGGIFEESITLPTLDKDFRDALLKAAAVDWSTISPAIFGSMFQSVRDTKTRRELGEHYTSEENILKTLNPLFLDELREELKHALALKKGNEQALNRLWTKLGEIRYMDPACGCGNFIIVAYRELRDLELQTMGALADLRAGEDSQTLDADWTSLLKVTLDHFYGIEIDEWPARIAETAMFLIDRQCDLKLKERFGAAPQRLPIQREATIVVDNAVRLSWTEILAPSSNVIVAGNPPFLGPKERSARQTQDLRLAWGTMYDGFLDYVSGWYARGIEYFGTIEGRWAFVSTNSISQGQAVPTLWGAVFNAGWRMSFAHRTFPWTSEASGGAAVHCVIVGFTRGRTGKPRLFEYVAGIPINPGGTQVARINAYLVDGPNVLVTKRMRPLSPDLPEVVAGSKAVDWGYLTVEPDEFEEISQDPIASRYLRPYKGGDELINDRDRWCLWFVGAALHELERSALIRERISKVRAKRLASTKPATRQGADTPHLFEERRQPEVAYVGIPQTFAESRRYATVSHLSPEVIASIKLFTSPDPDGFLFSIVSSSMFIAWQKTVGGRMKSDPSFTNTIVWNTLPMPPVAQSKREAMVAAGKVVLVARSRSAHKSLAEHYDPAASMSSELLEAHERLDEVVDRAFGAREMCSTEEQRQKILFKRYEELLSELIETGRKRSHR
jgi:hypothetical protein